jgi:hypothetical protein
MLATNRLSYGAANRLSYGVAYFSCLLIWKLI